MSNVLFFIAVVILLALIFMIQRLQENYYARFYYYPLGRRCRYVLRGKRQKGTVEWANGDWYYITPDEKKIATDLVHVRNVKPARLWATLFNKK